MKGTYIETIDRLIKVYKEYPATRFYDHLGELLLVHNDENGFCYCPAYITPLYLRRITDYLLK